MNLKQDYKETIILAIPIVIGQLSSLLMNITDNIIVGHLGAGALSAAAFANSCFYLVAVFGFGAMNAIPSLVAEARGAENDEAIRQNLRAGLWSALLVGTAIGGLCYLLAIAMPYMGQPAEDVRMGQPFLILMAYSVPFMILFSAMKGFFDGMEKTSVGMVVSIIGLVLNVFLNVGLIFGKYGFPEMGFIGSAWATLISRVVVFVLLAIALYFHPVSKPYLSLQRFDNQYFIENIKLGFPMGLQILFEVAAFSGAGIMIGWLDGDAAIIGRSAHQIALNMVSATFMILLGLSVAGSVRVGEAFGRGDKAAIYAAGKATWVIGMAVVIFTAALLTVFRYEFAAIYGIDDPRVIEVIGRLMIIASIFQVFDGAQCIGAGLLRGVQDVKIPTFITFIAYWVIWIPVAYWMGFTLKMGVDGIWYADVIALAFAGVCLNWRFWKVVKSYKF